LKHVANIAVCTLQIDEMWEVEDLQIGLTIVNVYATKSDPVHVYELGCRMNHSCAPNACWDISPEGVLRVCALKQIPAGEEVTVCYSAGLALLHWQARRRHLWSRGFKCVCKLCVQERSLEEASAIEGALTATGPHSGGLLASLEPEVEIDGQLEARSEPESEPLRSPKNGGGVMGQRLILPRSHLRCLQCNPWDGADGFMLDQDAYMRWLVDPLSVPILRRIGAVQDERFVVAGVTWCCTACGLRVNLQTEDLDAIGEQIQKLAEAEMQFTHRALEYYATSDSAKLMELWPMCERVLGPWHGVTLFCALHILSTLDGNRARKVKARLALAGVEDALVHNRNAI